MKYNKQHSYVEYRNYYAGWGYKCGSILVNTSLRHTLRYLFGRQIKILNIKRDIQKQWKMAIVKNIYET